MGKRMLSAGKGRKRGGEWEGREVGRVDRKEGGWQRGGGGGGWRQGGGI